MMRCRLQGFTQYSNVKYVNLRGDQSSNAPLHEKVKRVLKYYAKLIKYAAETDSKIFHILWLNKFTYLDRTLINLYYKLLGKKLLYTAHDINYRKLVGEDSVTEQSHAEVHVSSRRPHIRSYGSDEGGVNEWL